LKMKAKMKKEKILNVSISIRPEELEAEARHYWSRLFHRHQIETMAFGAELEKRFPPPAGATHHDPFDYHEFITNMIKKQSLGYAGIMTYDACVKPHLPWDKIKSCFKGLKIDEEHFGSIAMILKPWPFTNEFTHGNPKLERLVKSTCNEFNAARKKLGRPAAQIDRIQFPKQDLFPYGHLQVQCNYWMRWSEQVIKYGEKIPRFHFRYFGIEKGKYHAPQKHTFWTYATAGAVYYVNCFCHGSANFREPATPGQPRTRSRTDCNPKTCTTIHEDSHLVVAKLLKTLYPKIWYQDTKTIARNIKTRAERLIRR